MLLCWTIGCSRGSELSSAEMSEYGMESYDFPEMKGWIGLNQMSQYDYIKLLKESKSDYPIIYAYRSVDNPADRITIHALSKFENVDVNTHVYMDLLPLKGRKKIIKNDRIILYKLERKNEIEYFYLKDHNLIILKHALTRHNVLCDGICIDLLLKLK
jgi:hypothetical protein